MVNLTEAIILSIIQGITEWFPISSSGHLAIIQNLFGFQNLAFDVFLHVSSILAIVLIFWKDILNVLNIKKKENLKYILMLIIAIIPAAIIGMLFKDVIGGLFSSSHFNFSILFFTCSLFSIITS